MKVPGFPIPVAGELYSSVVARYLHRTAGYTKRNLGLIGLDRASAAAIVPIAVVELAGRMADGHPWCNNPRRIVESHTIVPLFLHSSGPEFYESKMEEISHGLNGNPSATLGLTKRKKTTGQNGRHNSKFCPSCVTEDIENLGFPVLYRQHQPAFVKYCARHSCPLHFSCVNCNSRTRAIMWRMAGQCDCETPIHPMVVEATDETSKNTLLWVALQVDHLLNSSSLHTDITSKLRQLLKLHDFIMPSGKIRNSVLIHALEKEIGSSLLYEFGFIVECSRRGSVRHDLARVFRTNHNGTNIIYNLFAAKLFFDDIRDISKICDLPKVIALNPSKSLSKKHYPDKAAVQNALSQAKGAVVTAAKSLNINEGIFRTAARYHQIAIPLTEKQCDRIGWHVLKEIREAIKNGTGLREACRVFDLGKYTISLIFGDQPHLLLCGKSSKEISKTQHAKEKLLALVESQPDITRTELRQTLSSYMDTVLINDSLWTSENIPKPIRKYHGPTNRTAWGERFQQIRLAIEAEKKKEFNKSERPARLTATRLRQDCGVTQPQSFPEPYKSEISRIFATAAEPKESFQDRLIKWAVAEYAKLLVPVSSNKLRRIAGLPIQELLGCRDLVIKYVKIHNLSYHSKCSLSPFFNPSPF